MSLHFIVDGYNALLRSGAFDQKRLTDAREAFLTHVRSRRPHGSSRNRLTIVFDGRLEFAGLAADAAGDVIFTAGASADEKIKDLVEHAPRPKDVVVVTDDKELGFFARRCGARLMSVKEFLGRPSVQARAQAAPEAPSLNAVEREKITEEMRRVWLKN